MYFPYIQKGAAHARNVLPCMFPVCVLLICDVYLLTTVAVHDVRRHCASVRRLYTSHCVHVADDSSFVCNSVVHKIKIECSFVFRTATVGYGSAPAEAISTLVIIIIAAGLGLPVILILIGSIYVCVKKSRGDYREIGVDDEDDDVTQSNPRLN